MKEYAPDFRDLGICEKYERICGKYEEICGKYEGNMKEYVGNLKEYDMKHDLFCLA